MYEHLQSQAGENFAALRNNSYPGRGFVMGLNSAGDAAIQVYWIMGRSPNSRNRVFIADNDGSLRTDASDPSTMTDPSLVIYRAMAEATLPNTACKIYVVSNGHQTDAVLAGADWNGELLYEGLESWSYEPDEPNFTPRITGLLTLIQSEGVPRLELEILIHKCSPYGEGCTRSFFKHDYPFTAAGYGLCVTTYMGDGNPLPSFTGEPYPLPIDGTTIEEIAQPFWDALDEENRVSLAVKMIDLASGKSNLHVCNKYARAQSS